MKIRASEAVVKTAQVEVKVLTISGKQVTLAVFRQLELEPLIDRDTMQFRGLPWGRVNYFWGDCEDDHYHVVWQKGNELRRACVFDHRPSDPPDRADVPPALDGEPIRMYAVSKALAGQLHQGEVYMRTDSVLVKIKGLPAARVHQNHPGYELLRMPADPVVARSSPGALGELRRRTEEKVRSYYKCDYLDDPAAVYERVVLPAITDYRKKRDEYDKRIKEIESLDQLFIAV